MSEEAGNDASAADHLLAARLFEHNPKGFGGICLRGFGPVRDALVEQLASQLAERFPVAKIPINVDEDRLLGGIDLAAALQSGQAVRRAGLLETLMGGIAILPMAERIDPRIAAHIVQAMDRGELSVILLDDGLEGDEHPPEALLERLAFQCDLSAVRSTSDRIGGADGMAQHNVRLTKKQRSGLVATAAAFGVSSMRAAIFAERCAVALARFDGRDKVGDEDLLSASRLVLAPRATQMPQIEEPPAPEQEQADQPDDSSGENDSDQELGDRPLEDMLLEAVAATVPPHILDQITGNKRTRSRGQGGRSGQKQQSFRRGRPKGTRPGIPGNGKRLALIDTLRAAAPWQTIRKNEATVEALDTLHIRKDDLRVHHYEEQQESLTIFAVDASGSSALARLAEAKGAVELLLAQSYVKRAQVALIAFRQEGAEVLLPPTRSLTRARRSLSALPGGGGTPLAAGLLAARQMAEAAVKRGQSPTLVMLTDGKANIRLDGEANRAGAMEEAKEIAGSIARTELHAIVIDISPRPRPEASELAEALGGKYVPLPHAHSEAMVSAIEGLSKEVA